MPKNTTTNSQLKKQLATRRAILKKTDLQLIKLLVERFKITDQIGAIKGKLGLSLFQPKFKKSLISRGQWFLKLTGKSLKTVGIKESDRWIKNLLSSLHDESLRRQKRYSK